ncbi:Ferrochelatase, protoheme ferro-lyase [Minicystis rosea]|nr:Ferrochelatase, protoheme ferro-lyase [Minicystis rosea]
MTTAVLLTCHGTVDRTDDIPAFLTNIRRGRPTPQPIIDEVTHRFQRIGGSPLMRITGEQADALSARLGVPVRVAGRLWAPFPTEVIAALVEEGVTTLVSLPMAPQSVDVYQAGVRAAAAAHPGLTLKLAPPWGTEPILIDAFLASIDEALARFADHERAKVPVILSAHSLPQHVINAGDPYEKQFRAMAAEVAVRLVARGNPVRVAFQSQGMDGGAWLGPDLPKTFAELAESGAKSAVIAAIGFVADHVETLYDLDIEAPRIAAEAGIERLERAPSMNARPRFIDALEAVVRRLM